MIGKTWIALMVGAFVMFGGLATVAAGSMSGDCDQTQDKLQLKDGSCVDDEALESADASGGMNGDCLQNKTQDRLKDGSCLNETLSAESLAMGGDCLQNKTQDQLKLQDGSCIDSLEDEEPILHFWSFYYSELVDEETPHMWQSQCKCVPA
ncbi:MAG: hypothetical protein MUC90_05615 [Thermoplasmata archaeon]|jgi:hypothetical protein|nr:hypothetical protein [Thermoplasmata archaeon]